MLTLKHAQKHRHKATETPKSWPLSFWTCYESVVESFLPVRNKQKVITFSDTLLHIFLRETMKWQLHKYYSHASKEKTVSDWQVSALHKHLFACFPCYYFLDYSPNSYYWRILCFILVYAWAEFCQSAFCFARPHGESGLQEMLESGSRCILNKLLFFFSFLFLIFFLCAAFTLTFR